MLRTLMKKRLRKKKGIGEFADRGFTLSVDFDPALDDSAVDRAIEQLFDVLEKNDLSISGGLKGRTFTGVASAFDEGGVVEEANREAMVAYLSDEKRVTQHTLGPLADLDELEA